MEKQSINTSYSITNFKTIGSYEGEVVINIKDNYFIAENENEIAIFQDLRNNYCRRVEIYPKSKYLAS